MSYAMYVPESFMGRTGYQIFVDRFNRKGKKPEKIEGRTLKEWQDDMPQWWPDEKGVYHNSDFYGGNLQGIIEKLDFIKDMGFDLIYLSPISNTHSSHHYDVENQMEIDPWIGTWSDFQMLCKEAHKRDILVCVDLVFNHMGAKSEIFQDALANKDSRYREWFEWTSDGKPVFWYGFGDLPQCNKLNPDYQKYATDVCEKYLENGADGIRLDLGEVFPKEFMHVLRDCIKRVNPQAIIVVEMWGLATHKENVQIYGDQADSVMNYPLSDAICRLIRCKNEKHFMYIFNELMRYPEQVQDVLWNFLDSHDVPRALNMLAGQGMQEDPFKGGSIWDIEAPWRKRDGSGNVVGFDTFGFRKWEYETDKPDDMDLAKKRLMLASFMQYSLRGLPIVYYGTEAGLTGGKDPFCRKPYPWSNEDKELIEHYKKLGRFRKEHKRILSKGNCRIIYVTSSILVYERAFENKKLIFVVNFSNEKQYNVTNMEGVTVVLNLQENEAQTLNPYGAIVYEIRIS